MSVITSADFIWLYQQSSILKNYKGEMSGDEMHVWMWNMEEINQKCQHCVCYVSVCTHLNECVFVSISVTDLGKMLECNRESERWRLCGRVCRSGGYCTALCWISLNVHQIVCSYCVFKNLACHLQEIKKIQLLHSAWGHMGDSPTVNYIYKYMCKVKVKEILNTGKAFFTTTHVPVY